jgi:H+/gluconate symporter-like permease
MDLLIIVAALVFLMLVAYRGYWKPVTSKFADGTKAAVAGSLLASMNTASEYGFGGVIAALPGFLLIANAVGIPMEVLHRVASMASGGMDTLPHNGAVITLLAVAGLTHRQSYKDIFAITMIKTAVVFVIIGVYYATGIV